MAFCSNCGSEIIGNAGFCSNCGTKLEIKKRAGLSGGASSACGTNSPVIETAPPPVTKQKIKVRKGMEVIAVICFVLALIMFFAFLDGDAKLFDVLVFISMGGMFTCLAFSPKSSPYLFGKSRGIKKYIFVILYVILIFFLIGNLPDDPETARVLLTNNMII